MFSKSRIALTRRASMPLESQMEEVSLGSWLVTRQQPSELQPSRQYLAPFTSKKTLRSYRHANRPHLASTLR